MISLQFCARLWKRKFDETLDCSIDQMISPQFCERLLSNFLRMSCNITNLRFIISPLKDSISPSENSISPTEEPFFIKANFPAEPISPPKEPIFLAEPTACANYNTFPKHKKIWYWRPPSTNGPRMNKKWVVEIPVLTRGTWSIHFLKIEGKGRIWSSKLLELKTV